MIKLLALGIFLSTAIGETVVATLVILGILFLTSIFLGLRVAVVAKLVILGVSPLTSFISALRVVLVAKLVVSGTLSSVFFILALYTFF